MRRVASVIDTWFDSGSMPWAQYHYPFENEELFKERFPADFICEAIDQTRGWFYTLLAESVLLFDTPSYRNVVCLGLILDPEGQKMSKSRGNVVEPWDVIDTPRGRRLPLVLLRLPAALGGLPVLGRDRRRGGPPVPADALEHLLASGCSTRTPRASSRGAALRPGWSSGTRGEPAVTELDRWALSRLQAHDRRGARADGRLRLHHAPPARSPTTAKSSRTGTCGSTAAASGTATAAAFATLRHCLIETAKLLAPFTPFLADEIYTNLRRRERRGRIRRPARTRSISATTPRSTRP